MASNNLIEFVGIGKNFPGVKALEDIRFGIKKGEVHAIVGENGAGKSTLMNILAGIYQPDSGHLKIRGKITRIKNYAHALSLRISAVYQEGSLVSNLSVAENIFADRQPKGFLNLINKKIMFELTTELCREIQLDVNPKTFVGTLIPSQAQMVEIAKALSVKSEILILDEPTSTITEKETQVLFKVIKNLRAKGISVIYISHRLQEIFKIADRVTVLKDGRYVGTRKVDEIGIEEVIRMMVGRDLVVEDYVPTISDKKILEIQNFSSKSFENISFYLKSQEILVFAGLAGSGRTEVFRALIGVDKKKSGEITIQGKHVKISSVKGAIKYGIGYLPENRKEQGVFLEMSIAANIVSGSLDQVSDYKILNNKKIYQASNMFKERLRIQAPDLRTRVAQLSGGNQQKVVFAKWLMVNPNIFIVDEPTRGVDVGSKSEIYRIIRELSARGTSIVVISSDLPEVLTLADRIIVMHNGSISGELGRSEATEEKIMHLASGIK